MPIVVLPQYTNTAPDSKPSFKYLGVTTYDMVYIEIGYMCTVDNTKCISFNMAGYITEYYVKHHNEDVRQIIIVLYIIFVYIIFNL